MRTFKMSYILLLILLSVRQLSAQPVKQLNKIQAFKIAFLTDRLDLTPKQAQMFWPVYNAREKKLNNLKHEHKIKMLKLRGELKNLSEQQVNALIEDEFNYRQQELDIKKEFNNQFKNVLPIRKVAALYRAEEDFKRELLKKIQSERRN